MIEAAVVLEDSVFDRRPPTNVKLTLVRDQSLPPGVVFECAVFRMFLHSNQAVALVRELQAFLEALQAQQWHESARKMRRQEPEVTHANMERALREMKAQRAADERKAAEAGLTYDDWVAEQDALYCAWIEECRAAGFDPEVPS
jgi:hypothetical protein